MSGKIVRDYYREHLACALRLNAYMDTCPREAYPGGHVSGVWIPDCLYESSRQYANRMKDAQFEAVCYPGLQPDARMNNIPGKWTVHISRDTVGWQCRVYKGASCVSIGIGSSRVAAWQMAHRHTQYVVTDLGTYIRPGQAGHVCVGVCCG